MEETIEVPAVISLIHAVLRGEMTGGDALLLEEFCEPITAISFVRKQLFCIYTLPVV